MGSAAFKCERMFGPHNHLHIDSASCWLIGIRRGHELVVQGADNAPLHLGITLPTSA
jgi:hypothetical protein